MGQDPDDERRRVEEKHSVLITNGLQPEGRTNSREEPADMFPLQARATREEAGTAEEAPPCELGASLQACGQEAQSASGEGERMRHSANRPQWDGRCGPFEDGSDDVFPFPG